MPETGRKCGRDEGSGGREGRSKSGLGRAEARLSLPEGAMCLERQR